MRKLFSHACNACFIRHTKSEDAGNDYSHDYGISTAVAALDASSYVELESKDLKVSSSCFRYAYIYAQIVQTAQES